LSDGGQPGSPTVRGMYRLFLGNVSYTLLLRTKPVNLLGLPPSSSCLATAGDALDLSHVKEIPSWMIGVS
jgi:hypothetical protein